MAQNSCTITHENVSDVYQKNKSNDRIWLSFDKQFWWTFQKMHQTFTRSMCQMSSVKHGHQTLHTSHIWRFHIQQSYLILVTRHCISETSYLFSNFWHHSYLPSDTSYISLSDTCHILLLTLKFHISLLIPISSHSYCIYRISSNWKYLHCIKVCVLVCWNIVHWHTHIHSHNYIK